MPTIEELERRAEEITEAECDAAVRLVAHLRDSAVRLPDGSRLALRFAKAARRIEEWPGRFDGVGTHAFNELAKLDREIREDFPPQEDED